jgi:hypothetical protein
MKLAEFEEARSTMILKVRSLLSSVVNSAKNSLPSVRGSDSSTNSSREHLPYNLALNKSANILNGMVNTAKNMGHSSDDETNSFLGSYSPSTTRDAHKSSDVQRNSDAADSPEKERTRTKPKPLIIENFAKSSLSRSFDFALSPENPHLPEKEEVPAKNKPKIPAKNKPKSLFATTESQLAVMRRLIPLNEHGRLDFVLESSALENPYISAMGAHMKYWSDADCNALVVRSLYGIK